MTTKIINKMKSHVIIFCLLGCVFLNYSCENLFDPSPDNHYGEDRFGKDPSYAEGLLLNAYSQLPGYTFSDVATDDAINSARNDYSRVATGEWSTKFNPLSYWDKAYTQLYYINYFLSIVDNVEWSYKSQERNKLFKQKHTGEAYALRAIYNYLLLQAHAGIDKNGNLKGHPILTTPILINDNWQLPRADFFACIEEIYKDCDAAMELLPSKYADTGDPDVYDAVFGAHNKNRIDGRIIETIKCRAALLAASQAFNLNNDNGLWENAAKLTGTMLKREGGLTNISPTGFKFYLNKDDKEIIWRGNTSQNNNLEKENYPPSLYGSGRINPTQNLADAFPMKNGYPITHESSGYNPATPYQNRDPRLKQYILYNGNDYDGRIIYTNINADRDGIGKLSTSTKTGFYLKKLLFENLNIAPAFDTKGVRFTTYVRYTELLLNYAEAANEAWDMDSDPMGYGFTARSIIAEIRKRAGIQQPDNYLTSISDKDELRNLIRNERRLELCFEGFRFWDLRRWNSPLALLNEPAKGIRIDNSTYTEFSAEIRAFAPYMIYGPIPEKETLVNPNTTQNKDW